MQAAEAHGLALRMTATAACSTTRHINASRGRVVVSPTFPTHRGSNGWTGTADMSDLVDRPSRTDGFRLRADRVPARIRTLVAALEDQPLRLGAPARALQRPAAAQLLALQPDRQMAVLKRLLDRALGQAAVGARVPHDDAAGAIARADPALELGVAEGVVVDLDGEALLARVGRQSLRDRPGLQDPPDLEAEVVVHRSRCVLLDDEPHRVSTATPRPAGVPSRAAARDRRAGPRWHPSLGAAQRLRSAARA